MKEIFVYDKDNFGISEVELLNAIKASLEEMGALKKVLIIPPDFTRFYSCAGKIANIYYNLLKDKCEIDVLPALGSHVPMTREECKVMFPDIPFEKIIPHNWRTDVVEIGKIPASFVKEVSEGIMEQEIVVEINRLILPLNLVVILVDICNMPTRKK